MPNEVPVAKKWRESKELPKFGTFQSYSSIKAWLKCPVHTYKKQYIDKVYEPLNTGLLIGGAWHAMWEEVQKERLFTSVPDQGLDTLFPLEKCQQMWDLSWRVELRLARGKKVSWDDKRTPDQIQEFGKEMVRLYHPYIVDLFPIGVEKGFNLPLTGAPQTLFGYMDLATSAGVVDYKTGTSDFEFSGHDQFADWQTDIYTVGYWYTFKTWPKWVRLDRAIFSSENPRIEVVEMKRPKAEVQARINEIKRIIGDITAARTSGVWTCNGCKAGKDDASPAAA